MRSVDVCSWGLGNWPFIAITCATKKSDSTVCDFGAHLQALENEGNHLARERGRK